MAGQGRRKTRRIRGTDTYGRDCWVTITVDVETQAVYIQAPNPVRLDVHGAHRLSSAAGEAHWIVLTGEDPPPEPV